MLEYNECERCYRKSLHKVRPNEAKQQKTVRLSKIVLPKLTLQLDLNPARAFFFLFPEACHHNLSVGEGRRAS